MSNEKNLIPLTQRTKDEQRAIATKGGKASGEARRKKKAAREDAELVLSLIPKLDDKAMGNIKDMGIRGKKAPNIQTLALLAVARRAMAGDYKALRFLLEISGDTAPSQLQYMDIDAERRRLGAQGTDADDMNFNDMAQVLDSMSDDELREYQRICEKFTTPEAEGDVE